MTEIAVITDDQIFTEESYEVHQQEVLKDLYRAFCAQRDEWVRHRAALGVETQWKRNTDLFLGKVDKNVDTMEDTLKNGPRPRKAAQGSRSNVVVNIVRPKVEQAIARICEILLPVDDKNWGIRPSPKPSLAQDLNNDTPTIDPMTGEATGITRGQEVEYLLEAARQMSESMEREINDRLTACNYNAQCRQVIADGVRLGTGVIAGPLPHRQVKKAWLRSNEQHSLVMEVSVEPKSEWVDVWDVFFDPSCGNDHQRGAGVWRRKYATRKELRQLAKLDGYDASAISKVLMQKPKCVRVAEGRMTRVDAQSEAYELWEYHGEIEPEMLRPLHTRLNRDEEYEEDPLQEVDFGVVAIVNDVVIGAMPSWIPDRTLPYDVWCWRKSDDSPYGDGLPEELDHQQRVVNAAWRQVMDNARVSIGGQIVMKKGSVIPANGDYSITPMKVWHAKDEMQNVSDAFQVFEFQSHINELMTIATSAMAMADTETSMPQILGGQQGSAPETVGGMVMLFNNASAILRQRVKLFDDCVTVPHITRHYDYQMVYNPDNDIKGDFEVDARGSTSLIERDIQNQALLNLANVTNNERYVPHLREREELKLILKAFKVNPAELMKSEEEYQQDMQAAAEQGSPEDPRVIAAQIAAELKMLELEDKREQRQFEAARNAEDAEIRRQNLQYNARREQAEFEIAQTDSSIKRDLGLLKLDQDERMTAAEIAAKERLEALKIDNSRQLFNAEAALKQQHGTGI